MVTSGLLTILAILISGYSLLPEEKRLDFRLRISWLDLIIVGIPVCIILVVIYSPVILSTGLIDPVGWRWGFNDNIMVFTCLAAIIVFFGIKALRSRLPKTKYSSWAESSLHCLRSKKFHQLGYLFNKYHRQLFSVIDREVWYVRVNKQIAPQPVILTFSQDEKITSWRHYSYTIRSFLAKLFPAHSKKQDVLELSVSRLLKSTSFVEYLAESYPMVAAKATRIRFSGDHEFVPSFFRALISHPGSPLYRELRDNQDCSHTGEYYLNESNPILNFYFKDMNVASDVEIWKPIGDYVIEYIKQQRGSGNYYNQPNDGFSDSEERWNSPIFTGSLFFEVMVSIAIFQRVSNHMWLMYTDYFLEEILKNLDYADNVDVEREFPSKFDYLMYEIFSSCDRWVGAVEYLNLREVSTENRQKYPEYWAAKNLGSMLRKIIASEKLSDRQKIYFLDIVARRMRKLDQCDFTDYSRVIFENIIRPYEYGAIDNKTIIDLNHLYQQLDHVLRSDVSTFKVEISKHLDSQETSIHCRSDNRPFPVRIIYKLLKYF